MIWYKVAGNGSKRTEIKNGIGYKLDRFNQLLNILDVTTNKAGDYVCVANNTEGKDEAFGRIIVAGMHVNTKEIPNCFLYLDTLIQTRTQDVARLFLRSNYRITRPLLKSHLKCS